MAKTAKASMINDMTEGNLTRQLLSFSWPFMLSNLLQVVYNLVDMIVVGQFVGSAGLSAVSNGGEMLHLFMLLCMGFATGGQIIISQYIGQGSLEGVKKTIGTMFTFITAMAVFAMLLGFTFGNSLLTLINIPEEAMGQAIDYTRVCYSGMIFVFGYNLVSAILRGMGDSKRPFWFIAIAAVTNLILDLVFVAGLGMEALGAALATVIGQGVSFVSSLIYLYIKRESFGFDFKLKSFAIHRPTLIAMLKLGIPMALQQAAITVSMLFVASYINAYGLVVSAVNGVGNKLGTMAGIVTGAFSMAGSSMIGQNFGARKFDRVTKIVYTTLAIGLVYSVLLSVALLLWPEQVFSIFDTDPEVLAMSHVYAIMGALNFLGSAFRMPFMSMVNGIGFAGLSFVVGILDGVVARVGLAMLLGIVLDMGIQGFWLGSVAAGFMPFIVCGIYFWSGAWKKRRLAVSAED